MTTTAEPRTWTITTDTGITASGLLPDFADAERDDPSAQNIPADRLELALDDVFFVQRFDGQEVQQVRTSHYSDVGEPDYVGPGELLRGGIYCHPYSSNPVERAPLVSVEILAQSDDWVENLDPAGVADLAAKLRAQADRLDNEVRPALIAARAEYEVRTS